MNDFHNTVRCICGYNHRTLDSQRKIIVLRHRLISLTIPYSADQNYYGHCTSSEPILNKDKSVSRDSNAGREWSENRVFRMQGEFAFIF